MAINKAKRGKFLCPRHWRSQEQANKCQLCQYRSKSWFQPVTTHLNHQNFSQDNPAWLILSPPLQYRRCSIFIGQKTKNYPQPKAYQFFGNTSPLPVLLVYWYTVLHQVCYLDFTYLVLGSYEMFLLSCSSDLGVWTDHSLTNRNHRQSPNSIELSVMWLVIGASLTLLIDLI